MDIYQTHHTASSKPLLMGSFTLPVTPLGHGLIVLNGLPYKIEDENARVLIILKVSTKHNIAGFISLT